MNIFNRLWKTSIYRRILTGFGIVIALIIILDWLTYLQLDRVRQNAGTILPHTIQTSMFHEIAVTIADLDAGIDRYFVMGGQEARDSITAGVETLQSVQETLRTNPVIDASLQTDDMVQGLTDLNDRVLALLALDSETATTRQTNLAILAAVQQSEQVKALEKDSSEAARAQLVEITNEQQQIASDTVTQVELLSLAVLVVALVASVAVSRSIARPLGGMVKAATQIASGDLDTRVPIRSLDETGQLAAAFNHMAENLQQMVDTERTSKERLQTVVADYTTFVQSVAGGNLTQRLAIAANQEQDDDLHRLGVNLNAMVASLGELARQIRQSASEVSATAVEILSAASQQNASTVEQQAAISQTMATVEEVQATVRQTAQRAQAVSDASQQSVAVSRQGNASVSDTMEGMEMIQERVNAIAENILALSERTQQIGDIIETVNDIAEQSKLLALNASIEAARAGEEGRGFAVVAMEVRQLAEQSREATARVRAILGEIQQATNTAVMVTEEGSKGAQRGMALVTHAGQAIRDLSGVIEESAQAATQIAASTQQQTSGMDQLLVAMQSIRQASIQTAASTKQAEHGAQNLADMARQLEALVARYQL